MDVVCQPTLCFDVSYITETIYEELRESIDMIAYQPTQLRNATLHRPSQPSKLLKQ